MNESDKDFFSQWSWPTLRRSIIPIFFILVEEILSRLLKHNFEMGKIVPFSHLHCTPLASHLLYVDDIMVFTNGGGASLQAISDVFTLYENWFG